jgi:hypothetical protein
MDQLYRDYLCFHIVKRWELRPRSRRGVQQYVIQFVSDWRQFVSGLFSPGTPPRFSLNIVESGVKHHKPTQTIY